MRHSKPVVSMVGAVVAVVAFGVVGVAIASQPERPTPTRPGVPAPQPGARPGTQPAPGPRDGGEVSRRSGGERDRAPFPRPEPSAASDEAALAACDELFATLSTKPGELRDWEKFQGLFAGHAQWSMVIAVPGKEGMSKLVEQSIEKYVQGQEGLGANNFHQVALRKEIQRYGNQAHVWSTYELRAVHPGDNNRLVGRGVASMQLVRENGVWLIQGVTVQPELKATPIPEAYLPKAPEKEAGPDAGADAGLPKEPALK